jgi:hypothetical protein
VDRALARAAGLPKDRARGEEPRGMMRRDGPTRGCAVGWGFLPSHRNGEPWGVSQWQGVCRSFGCIGKGV